MIYKTLYRLFKYKNQLMQLNLVSNNSLMCPLNDGIFYLSESATHQEEYFLKHDHYYGTINNVCQCKLLKSGLTVRHAYWKKISLILLKRRVPLN